ncbi:translation initiation factor IF-2-like [Mustela putorius furo]|uniref:Translation initiation factor IF-2-like n=1 Tax=Mustela putorius furo TaxID=9669 RepID=A0A8U0S1Z3_MUSPF|nr:translation initiation factor IF-2-like [Mustela putorius furo]
MPEALRGHPRVNRGRGRSESAAGLLAPGLGGSRASYPVRARVDRGCRSRRSAGQCSLLRPGLPSTPSKFSAFNSDSPGPEAALGLSGNGLLARTGSERHSRAPSRGRGEPEPGSGAGSGVRGSEACPESSAAPAQSPPKGPRTYSLPAGPGAPGARGVGVGGWGGHPPPQPRRTRPAPGVPPTSPAQAAPKRGRRRGGARGGPRFYLRPGSRPRAFPAPSAAAAAAAARLKGPGAGGARAARAGGGGGRRARRETRVSGPSYPGQVPRGAQGRRCAGRALEEDAEGEGIRPPSRGSPRPPRFPVRPISFRDAEGSVGEEPEASEGRPSRIQIPPPIVSGLKTWPEERSPSTLRPSHPEGHTTSPRCSGLGMEAPDGGMKKLPRCSGLRSHDLRKPGGVPLTARTAGPDLHPQSVISNK